MYLIYRNNSNSKRTCNSLIMVEMLWSEDTYLPWNININYYDMDCRKRWPLKRHFVSEKWTRSPRTLRLEVFVIDIKQWWAAMINLMIGRISRGRGGMIELGCILAPHQC